MGACSSCLGGERRSESEDESSRLLLDDPQSAHYGSFGDTNSGTLQVDPQDVQRENEELQRIVAQTSNHLVDIFAVVPQDSDYAPAATYVNQDDRKQQYRQALSRLAASRTNGSSNGIPQINVIPDDASWLSDDASDNDAYPRSLEVIKSKEMGPLLGGFEDVEKTIR